VEKVKPDDKLVGWGVAVQPLPGETALGDNYLVKEFPNGVLIAVIDGLGHGSEAAAVAETAVSVLAGFASEPIASLVKRCHERLAGTRGVVMSLASINAIDNTMTWLGVGNVDGVLLRPDANASPVRESLLVRSGIVGYRLPPLRLSTISLVRGDVLIFATDGIRSGFVEWVRLTNSPQEIAESIIARYSKKTDDALVLVARYIAGAM
jgi:negative regulator of sigma-B (phosphoserine phosphatase)